MAHGNPERRLTEEKLEFVRENRHEPPKKLAKALEVPLKVVERALAGLEDADRRRSARNRRAFGLLVALTLFGGAGYGIHLMMVRAAKAREDEEARRREAANRAIKDRIYEVLDKREPGHDDEIAAHLENEDEAIRLGAVRYLLLVGTDAKFHAALDHLFDKAQRVRLATVQLASRRPSPEVDEALAAAAARSDLALAERILALDALKGRPQAALLAVSAKLLEVLADRQEGLRRADHDLLACAFPAAAVPWSSDGPTLQAAWRCALVVRQ